MTHNPLMSRERVVIPPRRAPTDAEKTAAWSRENGLCYLCGKPVAHKGAGVQWDHRDNRAVSANDDVSNLYPVHAPECHVPKSALDAKRTAKVKRQEKLTQAKVKKPGGLTHPTLKRGLDGIVRPR